MDEIIGQARTPDKRYARPNGLRNPHASPSIERGQKKLGEVALAQLTTYLR